MSIILKTQKVKFKDPISGEYIGINAVSDENAETAINNWLESHPGKLVVVPLVAATAAAMTNTAAIYVYTGSQTGYTNGGWYYHNGSTWVLGGTYSPTPVDSTLSNAGQAADAKKTGELIAPTYSSSSAYAVGDYVNYNGALYKCKTTIGSGGQAWTAAHWEAVFLGDQVAYLKNAYVTPEMFGAKGDGVTDDTIAIQSVLNDGRMVLFGAKTYRVTASLTIKQGAIIGAGKNSTTLVFENGAGLVISERNVSISGLKLYGDGTGVGIDLSSINTNCMDSFSNLIINNFASGIKITTLSWCCCFTDVRINYCEIGINCTQTSNTNFNLIFINIYFNRCPTMLNVAAFSATFIGCNFGICAGGAIIAGTSSKIAFLNCNFECDLHVEDERIFSLSSASYTFDQCGFILNASSTSKLFSTYSVDHVIMRNCAYKTNTDNQMPDNQFWNRNNISTKKYGGIIFDHGCESIPRPNTYSSNIMNIRDVEASDAIGFSNNSILDFSKFSGGGQKFYNTTTNVHCYYNGTDIVDYAGNIIVAHPQA